MSLISDMRLLAAALLIAVPAGCATPTVLTEGVGTMRTGVALADDQSQLALQSANEVARGQSVERRLDNPSNNLSEANFIVAVSQDDMAKWDEAFGALDDYLSALQRLVDPSRAGTTATALTAIGAQLTSLGAKLPNGTAQAFATLGSAIVQAAAERRAITIMRATDPAFQDTIVAMANAIGADDRQGLRGTVASNWEALLTRHADAFVPLRPANRTERRRVIDAYLDSVGKRDTQLRNLAAVRRSIIAIGNAHAAAARGDGGTALFWIGRISGWVDQVRDAIEAGRAANNAGGAGA